jgi:hypothetical protein
MFYQCLAEPWRLSRLDLNEGESMSKNAWLFRPNHIRRAIRTIESAGLTPSGVEFADGWFKVLIDEPKRAASSAPPEQQEQAFNARLRKGAS